MNSENESTEALIRALRDENHQLRSRCCLAEKAFAENAELRKDKERLEWLGEHTLKCLNLKEPLRDAIDAAMKG